MLADIQGALGTGPATLCLAETDSPNPDVRTQAKLLVSTRPPAERGGPCQAQGCTACRDTQTVQRLRAKIEGFQKKTKDQVPLPENVQ